MKLLVVALISLTLFTSCVHFPYASLPVSSPVSEVEETKPLWIVCGDLHADFVVETSWLVQHGCKLPKSVKSYKYLCFGWGDRIAYTQRWGMKDVPNALFWPSESIVQVVAFNTVVEPTFPELRVTRVEAPAAGGAKLANFLNQSFSYSSSDATEPITLRAAKWGHGYFIKSPYSYYFPRMCNQWVSAALAETGIHTTKPTMTMTSKTLRKDLERYRDLE